MEEDLSKDLEIIARVMTIAETHNISVRDAFTLYIKQLKVKVQEQSGFSQQLKARIGPKKWDFLMEFVENPPSDRELLQSYQQAKAQGLLKPAKLRFNASVCVRNEDYIGRKTLDAGTIVEVECDDEELCRIWYSPGSCEYMFLDELEFIS